MHQADRVKLQFGFPQNQPDVPRNLKGYHDITMKILGKVSLSTKFQQEIATWHQRRQLVLTGVPFSHEVRPNRHYIRWYWGFFGNNLFVSRASLLGDPRERLRVIPQNQPDYPPTPQPNTQNQTHPVHTPQPNHTYYTPQPNTFNQFQNTFQYTPPMYPSFQNSPIQFGSYPESSHHSQHSHHSFTLQAESSHRFHQPSPNESFNLPPPYMQSSFPESSQQTQWSRPPIFTTTQMDNDAMNSLWALRRNEPESEEDEEVVVEEEEVEVEEEYEDVVQQEKDVVLTEEEEEDEDEDDDDEDEEEEPQLQIAPPGRPQRKIKPVGCGTHGHKIRRR
jgi:hypothetical protein